MQTLFSAGQDFHYSFWQGYPGKPMYLSIIGNNTHFNRQPSQTTIKLSLNGYEFTPKSITVHSDIKFSFMLDLPANAPLGYYSAVVHDAVDGDMIKNANLLIEKAVTPVLNGMVHKIRRGIKNYPIYFSGTDTYFDYPLGKLTVWLQNGNTIIKTRPGSYKSTYNAGVYIDNLSTTPKGTYDLYVRDSFDGTMVSHEAVIITDDPPPAILSITPDTILRGTSATINIKGANCHFTANNHCSFILKKGTDSVVLQGPFTPDPNFISLYGYIPYTLKEGSYTLTAYSDEDGHVTALAKVYLKKNADHKIVNLNPYTASPGSVFNMNIQTTNTQLRSGSVNVWLSQGGLKIVPLSITIVNDEEVNAWFRIPQNLLLSAGIWDVNINSSIDSALTLRHIFSVMSPGIPYILAVSPDTILRGKTTILRIKSFGTQFNTNSIFNLYQDKHDLIWGDVDQVISPTEIALAISPDTTFALGKALLFLTFPGSSQQLTAEVYISDYIRAQNLHSGNIQRVNVSPNPFQDNIRLTYYLENPGQTSLEIMEMTGRQVKYQNLGLQGAGLYDTEIDLSGSKLRSGMYILKIRSGTDEIRLKVIKT